MPILLKKRQVLSLMGEARRVSEKGWKGPLGDSRGPPPGCYAASISGSLLIGLRRASRLRLGGGGKEKRLSPFGPLKRRRARRRIRLGVRIASRLSFDGDRPPRIP